MKLGLKGYGFEPEGSQIRGVPKGSQIRGVSKGSQIRGVSKGSQIGTKAYLRDLAIKG